MDEEKTLGSSSSATNGKSTPNGRSASNAARRRPSVSSNQLDSRGQAAKSILDEMSGDSSSRATLVDNMNTVALAQIKLAYAKPTEAQAKSGGKIPLLRNEPIMKLKDIRDMDLVPVSTDSIAVRRDGDYSGEGAFRGIAAYDESYSFVGGITAPKRIDCRDTHGRRVTQLVKGEQPQMLFFFVQPSFPFHPQERTTFDKTP